MLRSIPASLFALASLLVASAACSGRAPDGGADDGMVTLDDAELGRFRIDRYEFPNVRGEPPRAYVNLATASAACAEVGKRLCTAAEWRRACAGPDGALRYGYGAGYEPDRCFVGDPLPTEFTSLNDYASFVEGAGARPDCATPEGVHDLIGNVEEWVLDDWQGLDGMLEGGAWYSQPRMADCSGRYSRQPDYRLQPDREVFSAGFRCCTSDEPLTEARIARDAQARLDAARDRAGEQAYAPDDEVALGDGLYIDRHEYPNRAGQPARVVVRWGEADALCRAAGKRLCTAREWQRACGGEQGRRYPYGDEYEAGACAVFLDEPPLSGAFPRCVSDGGAVDLVGGVWEWTASALALPERARVDGEALYEVRGGGWFVDDSKGQCRAELGYPAAPAGGRYPDVGFRCCRGGDGGGGAAGGARDGGDGGEGDAIARPTCPAGMVALPGFCIDTHEHPNVAGERPPGGLDLAAARTACAARGRRLCTPAEWERACAGAAGRRWPYGDEYDPTRCNFGVAARGGEDTPAVAPSGQYAGCRTAEWVFDLTGNLWEWTVDGAGTARLQGGGWNANSGLGQCTAGVASEADVDLPEVGARCCADGDGERTAAGSG